MQNEATITLGGVEYTVPAFTLSELEKVGDLLGAEKVTGGTSVRILKMALARATPKCEDIGNIRTDLKELQAATAAVLTLAGLEPANPMQAATQQAPA